MAKPGVVPMFLQICHSQPNPTFLKSTIQLVAWLITGISLKQNVYQEKFEEFVINVRRVDTKKILQVVLEIMELLV